MKEVFEIQNPAYNFRSEATHFKRENVKTTHYGIQSVRYLGPKIWDMVPNNIKKCISLNKFKNSIKPWKPNECPCRLCKKHITQVGFIWFTSTSCNISEEKILIFYIHFVFVHCAEWGSFAWFPSVFSFFSFFFFLFWCAVSADFLGDLPKGLRRRCIFLRISWLRNWVKFLYFVQWLSLSFVSFFVLSFVCHYLLFIYYYYIIFFWLWLIRHILFCWWELL